MKNRSARRRRWRPMGPVVGLIVSAIVAAAGGLAAAGPGVSPVPPIPAGPSSAGVAGNQRTVADDVIERVGRYVLSYEKLGSAVVAEEVYLQQVRDRSESGGRAGVHDRTGVGAGTDWADERRRALTERPGREARHRELRSDVLLVQLPDRSWYGFRDVIEVDGHAVRDRLDRLQQLFLRSQQKSQQIVDESARYNIGQITRNINLPTFALGLLHPGYRDRFSFRYVVERAEGGEPRGVLSFVESTRPTLVRGDGDIDVPVMGRAWVVPSTGAVLRTELIVGGERSPRARTTVSYAWDEAIGLFLPQEMLETYDQPAAPTAPYVECRAQYSNFRRFQVKTDEKIVIPK